MKKLYYKIFCDIVYGMKFEKRVLCSDIDDSDVEEAEREYKKYMNKTGWVYERNIGKEQDLEHFYFRFFGRWDDIGYRTPSRFICSNENVSERLGKFLKGLEYRSSLLHSYRKVVVNGRYVDIVCGEY